MSFCGIPYRSFGACTSGPKRLIKPACQKVLAQPLMRPCKTFEEGVALLRGQADMALEGDALDQKLKDPLEQFWESTVSAGSSTPDCTAAARNRANGWDVFFRFWRCALNFKPWNGWYIYLIYSPSPGPAGFEPVAAGAFVPGAALASAGGQRLLRSAPIGPIVGSSDSMRLERGESDASLPQSPANSPTKPGFEFSFPNIRNCRGTHLCLRPQPCLASSACCSLGEPAWPALLLA